MQENQLAPREEFYQLTEEAKAYLELPEDASVIWRGEELKEMLLELAKHEVFRLPATEYAAAEGDKTATLERKVASVARTNRAEAVKVIARIFGYG